jgi:hypothetical protein
MPKRIIVVRLFGGLGNQLFSYSAARRLALVSDGELVIDHITGFQRDKLYRRSYQLDHFHIPCRLASPKERLEPLSRLRRRLLRGWNSLLPFSSRNYIFQSGVDYDPRLIMFQPKGNIYIEGYWQSEQYFRDAESQIRNDLLIHPPCDAVNLDVSKKIQKCSAAVAVHVRFFDVPSNNAQALSANNASSSYYNRAIKAVEAHVKDPHYFVFSDRPEAARTRIPISDERMTLVTHNQSDKDAYADLWLMSQCQHFIIANSTFSWWSAWLAQNPEKLILAPKFQKRDGRCSWGFAGLLPNYFHQV